MKKSIITILLSVTINTVLAEDKFLGVFTTDSYPVDDCKITRTSTMLFTSRAGWIHQFFDEEKGPREVNGYIKSIDETPLRTDIIKRAKAMRFNAIIGYKYDVFGGINGFDGKVINDSIGFGFYSAIARGVPVKVVCE